MSLRLFFGIGIDQNVQSEIQKRLQRSELNPLPGKPLKPRNWHITLLFLGNVDQSKMEPLDLAVEEAAPRFPESFELAFQGFGVFPNKGISKILWLGVEKSAHPVLQSIHETLREAMSVHQIPFDSKGLSPHLTLSRSPKEDLNPKIKEWNSRFGDSIPMQVSSIALFRSHVSQSGSEYEVIRSWPLAQ